LSDPFSYGRRARALVRVARVAPNANADTIARLMQRAADTATTRPVSRRQLNLILHEIAEQLLVRGIVDYAAVMGRDPGHRDWTVFPWRFWRTAIQADTSRRTATARPDTESQHSGGYRGTRHYSVDRQQGYTSGRSGVGHEYRRLIAARSSRRSSTCAHHSDRFLPRRCCRCAQSSLVGAPRERSKLGTLARLHPRR
jgi:hypothetical protein